MFIVTQERIDQFHANDDISPLLEMQSTEDESLLTSQQWLSSSVPKRYIYQQLYGDLLSTRGMSILDVGGGLTALSRMLSIRHKYSLADIMDHDNADLTNAVLDNAPLLKCIERDWYELSSSLKYDVIIANDIFPNVDQRLEYFVEKYLRNSCEIRFSLTFFNELKYYKVRRVDCGETLYVQAWNLERIRVFLNKYKKYIVNFSDEIFSTSTSSVFENSRQVLLLKMTR